MPKIGCIFMVVSLVKLCQWSEIPRRTVYYQPTKGKPKLQEKGVHQANRQSWPTGWTDASTHEL